MGLRLATHDFKHGRPYQAVFFAELGETNACYDVSIRVHDSKRRGGGAVFGSTLSTAVSHVVGLCAEKQVIRPNASSIVALVTNVKVFIKRAVSKLIGNPVSHKSPAGTVGTVTDNTVAVGVLNAGPFPTFTRLINFAPKTIFEGCFSRQWKTPFRDITMRYAQCQP